MMPDAVRSGTAYSPVGKPIVRAELQRSQLILTSALPEEDAAALWTLLRRGLLVQLDEVHNESGISD